METLELEQNIKTLESKLKELYSSPKTRISAVGGMIYEGYIIHQIESVDEQLGNLRAKLHALRNSGNTSEIELVYYGHNHIVETHIKSGILVRGGLLENHFKGRLATEHHSYVRDRHDKQFYKLEIQSHSISINNNFRIIQGEIKLNCEIGGVKYSGTTEFVSRVNEKTYFYFSVQNMNFLNLERPNRGLSKREKNLLKYACAMLYREEFKSGCNINLVD